MYGIKVLWFKKKKCKWVGKVVTTFKTNGCRWVSIGKNIRRMRCCVGKKVCVDKKCHLKNKKCKFTSLPIKFNYITKCHWKKSKNEKTKTCCRYFQKCVGRKCKKSNRTCKVVQHLTRQKKKRLLLEKI